jgi:tRNA-splicing ligase RtcB
MLGLMNKPGQVVPVKLWTPIADVEYEALTQLEKIARLPWVFKHVAVMPDVHYGKGATVGSVIAMKGAVSPAAVGVDIGCGMGAIKTRMRASDLPDNLEAIRAAIEATIPVGFNAHEEPAFRGNTPEGIKLQGIKLFDEFTGLTEKVQDLLGRARRQVGTLGGGNHFIEICLDDGKCPNCENGSGYTRHVGMGNDEVVEDCRDHQDDPHVWLMLHSGSRNIGKVLAEHHIGIAKKLAHNDHLPDKDLAVFLAGTPEMAAYRNDLFWAQRYAFFNRRVMFVLFKQVMRQFFPTVGFEEPILCHHNFVAEETHFGEEVLVTRKGAIRAGAGELGIIPGSMGTKSYIVRGRGNADSFCSASHGAGRTMSRTEAKRRFTVEDVIKQTAGVCCRKDAAVIEEIPESYKDIEQVMRNQADLVEVCATLKQVLCVKGN